MPKLVHLNGPPGIGKSTLARRYLRDHPLSFCLDIDGFRCLIGGWDEHPEESGRLARRMAVEMASAHLAGGHDVVVPQYVVRASFVDELAAAARAAGATFHEVVLMDDRAAVEARFEGRADDPLWAAHHRDAVRMMAAAGGIGGMYDRIIEALPTLPGAVVVRTCAGDVEASYAAALAAIRVDS